MSVLIKHLAMPSSCDECPMCYDLMECTVSNIRFDRETCKCFDFSIERHPDCPLEEVADNGKIST